MAIPEQILAEIKYRNDIETVVSQYVTVKRAGKNLVGLCPFHNEKTPSFTLYPENGSFYCFGCGAGGDVFTFTRLIENLDYIEAVKLLADKAGVTIPEKGYDDSFARLKQRILDINREAARFFHEHLMSDRGKWARDYLLGRGLTMSTIKHFGLGAAPDSWDELLCHLKSKGFKDDELLQANVVSKSSRSGKLYDRFRNRVMFPIINLRGNVIAFSGRARPDTDEKAKYINSSDTVVYKKSQNLFGINFAKNHCSDRVILVEGNMDVVSLHQAGFPNTVAPLGTAFTEEQVKLLSRYTKEIVITMDADAAGQKAVMRAIETMQNSGLPIRVLVLPECKDPDEFIKKNGAARFKALIEGAVNEIDYRLLMAAQGINLLADDGKIKYLQEAAKILSTVTDSIAVDLYISRLSEKYGVSKTALADKISQYRKNLVKEHKKQEIREVVSPRFKRDELNPEKHLNPRAAKAEETVLSILIQHPDLFDKAYEQLRPEDFITAFNKALYEEFSLILKSNSDIDLGAIGDRFSPAEIGYIVYLQNNVSSEKNAATVLNDCIKILKSEKFLKDIGNGEASSTDDWEKQLNDLINLKKGE